MTEDHAAPGQRPGPGTQPLPPGPATTLHVLHAVRLGGFADTPALAERAELSRGTVEDTLIDLGARGLIERMSFADTAGWILTEAGTAQHERWLAEERQRAGATEALVTAMTEFDELNARVVDTLSRWQLQSPEQQAHRRVDVLPALRGVDGALRDLLADPIALLPRLGRYPRQFAAALRRVSAGEDRWVAGVGILSCHTVWAELHQDLLSTLGRPR